MWLPTTFRHSFHFKLEKPDNPHFECEKPDNLKFKLEKPDHLHFNREKPDNPHFECEEPDNLNFKLEKPDHLHFNREKPDHFRAGSGIVPFELGSHNCTKPAVQRLENWCIETSRIRYVRKPQSFMRVKSLKFGVN